MPNKSPGKKSPLTPGVPVLRAHRFAGRMRRNDIRISLLVERLEQRIEFKEIDQSDELGRKLGRVDCAAFRVGADTRAGRPVKTGGNRGSSLRHRYFNGRATDTWTSASRARSCAACSASRWERLR